MEYRALLIEWSDLGVFFHCRVLRSRALRALSKKYRALLTENGARLTEYRAILKKWSDLGIFFHCRVLRMQGFKGSFHKI